MEEKKFNVEKEHEKDNNSNDGGMCDDVFGSPGRDGGPR
jgi:hypothetical protein